MYLSKYDNHMADLSSGVIEQEVRCRFPGEVTVKRFDTIGSTNTWVKTHLADSPLASGQCLICAAEQQTAGRGRRGKTWHSPDRGVTFTTAFTVSHSADQLSGLSLLCGAATCDVLRALGIPSARVKWPNDILVNGAKLAGILVEVIGAPQRQSGAASTTVIVGIGVNYRRGQESGLIDQHSTDMLELVGSQLPDRSLLVGSIAGEILNRCDADIALSVARLVEQWSTYDALSGQMVECEGDVGQGVTGRVVGIDQRGCLLVDTADGRMSIAAGSIRVRSR